MRTLLAARRRLWLVGASVLAGLVLAVVALWLTPVRYESSAVVNIAPSTVVAATDLFGSSTYAQGRATTYAALVTSESFAAEVAATVGLDGRTSVTAVADPDTSLITVTATAPTPQDAQRATNSATELLAVKSGPLDTGPDGRPALVLTVVDPASLPADPAQPIPWIFIVAGLVVGAAAGLSIARVVARSDNRINRPSDLVDVSGASGAVFWLPDRRWNGEVSGPRHAEYGERLAAVHQEFVAMPGRDSRILLIAAPTQPHAETAHQVVDDLSTTLVRGGRRVVVLRLQGDEQQEHRPGLSDLLAGSLSMGQVVFRDLSGRFDLGPGQQILRLLTATEREVRAVMDQLRSMADFVIVDAPPLSSPVGFPVMSQVADAVLMTATPKDLRADELTTARAVIDRLRVRYLGLLLAPQAPIPTDVRVAPRTPANRGAVVGSRRTDKADAWDDDDMMPETRTIDRHAGR